MTDDTVTLAALQQMKRDGRKIAAVVAYDYQIAQIVDRAGVDVVSVGDSVGVNLWGHDSQREVTLDQMTLVCRAVRRGVTRALVSCDLPAGPIEQGPGAALDAAKRLIEEGGADLIKLDGASSCPDALAAIVGAGIPVWAQFGIAPHTADGGLKHSAAAIDANTIAERLREARLLEDGGAVMLDFTNSGPVAGPEVVRAARIPVLGGLGGGPWLDGRIRSVVAAIGYAASALEDSTPRYANVAEATLHAIEAFCDDVRGARQIRGGAPATRTRTD
jgi:3-methyl-2-oxobutanoate hydroxymethyltransferase